jgi:sugar lactone lactonase YvrE
VHAASDGVGTAAQLYDPSAITIAPDGTLYVVDMYSVRKVSPDGNVTTFAGMLGITGFANARGTAAMFSAPNGIVLASDGMLYIVDITNKMVRAVSTNGTVTTLAGQLDKSGGCTNAIGTAASFFRPLSIGISPDSTTLFVVDQDCNNIRKVVRSTAQVTVFAGGAYGTQGYSTGTGTSALFSAPKSITVDGYGNLYVCDLNNYLIRKISPGAVVTNLLSFKGAAGITITPDGSFMYVSNVTSIIRVSAAGVVTRVAGGNTAGYVDGVSTSARFYSLTDMVLYQNTTLYTVDTSNNRVRKIVMT